MSLRWLTRDGVAAAAMVGGLVVWGAGLGGVALLVLFLVTGSLLTARNQPSQPPRRNARQVLANGGWAAAGAALVRWEPDVGWAVLLGSLATAQADTWATEIGARAARPPVLITTRRPVPAGTSGGVSFLGTGAGILGAIALTGLGALVGAPLWIAAMATIAAVLGMLVDSLLGATLEAASVLDNDGVNLAATSFGAAAALALTQAIRP